VSLDTNEFLLRGIEDRHARQCHRLREYADDEKFVFDVVHAVVAVHNLGLVNRTDDDRSNLAGLRGRSAGRESENSDHYETDARLSLLGGLALLLARLRPSCLQLGKRSHQAVHREHPSGRAKYSRPGPDT